MDQDVAGWVSGLPRRICELPLVVIRRTRAARPDGTPQEPQLMTKARTGRRIAAPPNTDYM